MVLSFLYGPWDGAEIIPRARPLSFIEPIGSPYGRPQKWRMYGEEPGFDHYALGSPRACDTHGVNWEYVWRARGGPRSRQVEPAPAVSAR